MKLGEDKLIEYIEQMTQMKTHIEHQSRSFDEFRQETKEYHHKTEVYQKEQSAKSEQQIKAVTQAIDEMKKQWQEMGGVFTGFVGLQKQVNDHQTFLSKHGNYIEKIHSRANDNVKRAWDLIWKVVPIIAWVSLIFYVKVTNQTKTIELQDSAFNQLIKTIEYENQN